MGRRSTLTAMLGIISVLVLTGCRSSVGPVEFQASGAEGEAGPAATRPTASPTDGRAATPSPGPSPAPRAAPTPLPIAERPPWWGRLYNPTQITRIADRYFIVDAWHDRVIWSYDLDLPIAEWGVVDRALASPHSVAGDGRYVAVEDTDRNAVNFYAFRDGGFVLVDRAEDVGVRPHRVRFHDGLFKVLAADTGEIYHFRVEDDAAALVGVTPVPGVDRARPMHVRSFTITEDEVWFTSTTGQGRHQVVVTDLAYALQEQIETAEAFGNMNDLFPLGDRIVVTATFGAITVVDELAELTTAENRHPDWGFISTPYYPSLIDGELFIPEGTRYSRIASWRLDGLTLVPRRTYFDHGAPTSEDLAHAGGRAPD